MAHQISKPPLFLRRLGSALWPTILVISLACGPTPTPTPARTSSPIATAQATAAAQASPTAELTATAEMSPTAEPSPTPQVAAVDSDDPIAQNAQRMLEQGRHIFRYDTFGDEVFWGDALRLHEAIAGEQNGGIGSGLTPTMALSLGLKVDMAVLPQILVEGLKAGTVSFEDPATTLALLRANAVVGVTGFFDEQDNIQSIGIQCALCHSTVDDALLPGIGNRLDGWPNRDLDVGAIVALAPSLQPFTDLLGVDDATVRQVLNSWGPGKFDAELILDGKATRPDGGSAATLLPPAFGLAGVNLHTWTGWGSVTHWNAFVANLEMHGQGTFYDPRLDDAERFPVAAEAGLGNLRNDPDLITSKLAALHFYQLAIPAPTPPEGSFDPEAAARGEVLFNGEAQCATCHVPPLYTEPGWNMHTAEEIGIDDFQAQRSPDQHYRTAPLAGLWTHMKGGFYHDGRFATLPDVVQHYNEHFGLGLNDQDVNDLVEFLKSLPQE
jgi:mono/diheme cytochrome c family protein